MAIQTRYAGDSNGIVNVDNGVGSLGNIIATGLTKNPIAIRVVAGSGQSFGTGDLSTGGSVETILRAIAQDSTITMYQVDASAISILLEATGAQSGEATSSTNEGAYIQTTSQIASALQTRIQGLTANIGNSTGNIWANTATVTGSLNFKLAAS